MNMRAWSVLILAGCSLAAAGEPSKTAPDAARSAATSVDTSAPPGTKPAAAVIDAARMKQIVRDLAIAQSTAPRPLDGSAPPRQADARDRTSETPFPDLRRGYTDADCNVFGCAAYDAQGQRLYTRWNENIFGLEHGSSGLYRDPGSCLSTNNLMTTFERCVGVTARRNVVDATPKPRRK